MDNRNQLEAEFMSAFKNLGFKVVSMKFLSTYLSETRNQWECGSCTFVACVTAVEMLYRMSSKKVDDWNQIFYFDVQDVYDHLFKLPEYEDTTRLLDVTGDKVGCRVEFVLDFAIKYGFLPSSRSSAPLPRNLLSKFNHEPRRYKISSYRNLSRTETFEQAGKCPIVAELKWFYSFSIHEEILYEGPSSEEILGYNPEKDVHMVVVVGKMLLRNKYGKLERHLIIHNSYGDGFGHKGLVVLPLKKDDIFIDFWKPAVVKDEMAVGSEGN